MNKNKVDEKIELVLFNHQWSEIYKKESVRIQEKLGDSIISMQHIGSTAIPNIYTKPIIDIMIGVDLDNSETIIRELIALNYESLGEANVPGRLYFRSRGEKNFNIALCQFDGNIWKNNILFRDYLRKYPDVAKRYSLFKKETFESGADTLLKYSSIKHSFISDIIKKANKDNRTS